MVSVELKTVSLPVDKLSTVQGALQTADLANLRSLFAAAKTARDAAVAAVSDADMANKDAQREKDKANQYQSEYDHVKKNTHVNHNELLENLKTAKDNASRLDAVAKGNATNVKSAVSAYNAALAAYNTAFKAASPSIDTFKHAAGL
jgi:hypothetical protein